MLHSQSGTLSKEKKVCDELTFAGRKEWVETLLLLQAWSLHSPRHRLRLSSASCTGQRRRQTGAGRSRAHCGQEPRALHPPGRQVTTWVPGCTGAPGTRLHLIFKESLRHISSSIAINAGLISHEINSVPPPSSASLLGKCPLERQKAELSLLHPDA